MICHRCKLRVDSGPCQRCSGFTVRIIEPDPEHCTECDGNGYHADDCPERGAFARENLAAPTPEGGNPQSRRTS